ncbi:MAG: N-acyl homoserine lactonase family protein [Syntrophorhabdales bacterium]|jgi:glyoxylase-like metal-dependent hydrolase (beta-lactamase superfamily II)
MSYSRRDFLKTGAFVLGTTAVSAAPSPVYATGKAPSKEKKNMASRQPAPNYEIYALKYAGPFKSRLAMLLWNEGWDEEIERNYYIWAIKAKDEIVVVDSGTGVTLAEKKKLKNYVNPVEMLKRVGANESNVKKVIITHIHFDHVGGVEMFPKAFPDAKFYVQKKEFDFWIKNPIGKRPPFAGITDPYGNKTLADLVKAGRGVLVDGDTNIMPGIDVILAPGHTVGLQAVVVNTEKGKAIVASDCAHIARSFKEDIPSCLITDMVGWMKTYDKLRGITSLDLIFPGHDTLMLTNYPKVAEDVTRLV